jgi:uncharacterized Zn finger protein
VTIRVPLDAATVPGTHLVDLLDRDMLEAHAGLPVYMRGVDYAVHGHVTDVGLRTHRATAAVLGTRPYDVTVEHVGSELACSCSCPAGSADEFCKHLVALGIELLGDIGDDPEPDPVDADTLAAVDVEAWLAEQPADRLRGLLLAEAARDPQVHKRLSVHAAADAGEQPDLSTLRVTIADAFSWGRHDSYGYVHYRDAWAWRHDVESVIGELTDLLDAGFAAEAVDLTEMVLAELNDSLDHVDDSDGHLHDLAGAARDLHLRACGRAAPDPVALAGRLLHWAIAWELDLFLDAVRDYAPALGDAGLTAYRTLAERQWERVPAIGPDADRRRDDSARFAITTVMEHVADVTGGLDDLLEVMRRDQASGYAFVRIAQACRDHARDDLALDWARRGLQAFPGEWRLTELIGDIHAEAGRHEEALDVDRELFADAPSLARYKRLRRRAEAAGRWPGARAPALAVVRDAITHQTGADTAPLRRRATPAWLRHDADGSVLVEILLWEGDGDAAWEAAQRHGCSDQLWSRVAATRGERHPADALEIYHRQLDRALQPADQRAYNEVVRLLTIMRPLYTATGRSDDFDDLVTRIRTDYKRRRTLLRRLDDARL